MQALRTGSGFTGVETLPNGISGRTTPTPRLTSYRRGALPLQGTLYAQRIATSAMDCPMDLRAARVPPDWQHMGDPGGAWLCAFSVTSPRRPTLIPGSRWI